MKKRALIITSAVMIAIVSMGGYVFAKDINNETLDNNQERAIIEEGRGFGYGYGYCRNSEVMIEVMKKSGYEDMAKWMEEGNFEEMDKFMNNLTLEEYQKMMDEIHQKRYEYMSEEGTYFARRGRNNRHHGMMRGYGGGFNRMGRF